MFINNTNMVCIVQKVFAILSISLLYPKEFFTYNSKQLGRKNFQCSKSQFIPICYYVNKSMLFELINKSLAFNLIAILKKILATTALHIFRLFT